MHRVIINETYKYRCRVTDTDSNTRSSHAAGFYVDTATWYFTYNSDGIRTQRTDTKTTYNYIYNGSQLTHMTVTDTVQSDELHFAYDASGVPMTVTLNGVTYYYAVNLQGDIVGIHTADGTQLVTYTYDSWGNPLSTTTLTEEQTTDTTLIATASTLAQLNPLRYRGYVYDQETGLYYLQSRYYNPALGRFINIDAFVSTGQGILGNNMYAYCGNNPLMRSDPTGAFFEIWDFFEDLMWKQVANVLGICGYDLTSDLLYRAACGPNGYYYAGEGSYASELLANDSGFQEEIRNHFCKHSATRPYPLRRYTSDTLSYMFPLSNGDLGAALHWVSYSYTVTYDPKTRERYFNVTVTDTFDFTELRNPFEQDSFIEGLLWFANDIAYLDMAWGLLDPVSVKISLVIPVEP